MAKTQEKEPALEREPRIITKVKSGIQGFDDLLDGGIPEGNLVVLSGDPGSGKTVFCWQFLYEGITKYDENGVYISLEESSDAIFEGALDFGWDFDKLIKQGKLKIVVVELYDFDRLKNLIEDTIRSIGAKRVVIDPGVIFRLFFERELDARKRIVALGKMLKETKCTTIITNEISLDKKSSLYGLEEYVADGVVLLYHTRQESRFIRSIAVLKMRNTKISEKLKPIRITAKGLEVLIKSELFAEGND